MSQWMAKFGLGGVQDFINQARKTRDVAAGSEIIGAVSYAMAENAATYPGAVLFLPRELRKTAWPNQFTLLWERVKDDDEVRRLCEKVEEAGRAKWRELLEEYLGVFHPKLDGWVEPEAESSQIASSLEIYWVAMSVEGKALYKDAYPAIGMAYDDRRNTRTFTQLKPFDSAKPWTCSMCGVRASVLQPRGDWPPTDSALVTKRESLCAICAAKRMYGIQELPYVPSTHRYAHQRFHAMKCFKEIREGTEERVWDEVLENLDVLSAGHGRGGDARAFPSEVHLEAFRKLQPKLKAVRAFSPYYGLIVFDGDEMGKWMRGKGLPETADETEWKKALTSISDRLMAFAAELRARVKKDVTLLYVGGDDGFAFVALDDMLEVMKTIHETWTERFGEGGATISVHASVVHAKSPLQPAIANARQSLLTAKERANRNCFSVRVVPAGGAPAEVITRWDDAQFERFVELIELLTNWRLDDSPGDGAAMPSSLLHAILESIEPFFSEDLGQLDLTDDFRRELDRLYARSGASQGEGERWCTVRDWLIKRGENSFGGEEPVHGKEFIESVLVVAQFLARQLEWKGDHETLTLPV